MALRQNSVNHHSRAKLHTECKITHFVINYTLCVKLHICFKLHTVCEITHCVQNYTFCVKLHTWVMPLGRYLEIHPKRFHEKGTPEGNLEGHGGTSPGKKCFILEIYQIHPIHNMKLEHLFTNGLNSKWPLASHGQTFWLLALKSGAKKIPLSSFALMTFLVVGGGGGGCLNQKNRKHIGHWSLAVDTLQCILMYEDEPTSIVEKCHHHADTLEMPHFLPRWGVQEYWHMIYIREAPEYQIS